MSRDILNQYHRAGKRFAEALEKNREAERLREKLAQNGRQSEKLAGVYYHVHIDEDWISRIERGIPHLEAAIREDRQFIKTEGNVTPIERVRKVSRSSVEHLARHSEMITHKPAEGDDLIPDKLQVFENESNFAVYENRVLYMVLCYTRDFLDYRYAQILKAWKERNNEMSFQKTLRMQGGNLEFSLMLRDSADTLGDEEGNAERIARIENAYGEICGFLTTPLMKEVAFAPMVTPPITRTNVLRMDVHFREVVSLYDYLSTYSGDGYTLERHETSKSPFSEEMEREINEVILYSLYLNEKYGRDLTDELEAAYQEEEKQRLLAAKKARDERLQALRDGDDDVTLDELLELFDQALFERDARISELLSEIEDTKGIREEVTALNLREQQLRARIDESMRKTAEAEKRANENAAEGERKEREYLTQIATLREEVRSEIEKRRFLSARMIGMAEKYGIKSEQKDYSEKEAFLELEKEREAFERVYQSNWKKAKQKIRKKVVWGRKQS